MKQDIYGSIPEEGRRIDEFAEILNEELNSQSIRVKRKNQFEWKARTGINTKGRLQIYKSGSNIVYEGRAGYNYTLLVLSLILTVALVIVSLFFIYYGIFFTVFFVFVFLALGGVERLQYAVKKAIESAISRLSPQPNDLTDQGIENRRTESEYGSDRYCMYCGRRIPPDTVYCPRCGGKIR
ncbi:MAG: zinc ribbon domain-containing protein [Candidatus Freyarchaeum deiterrae]